MRLFVSDTHLDSVEAPRTHAFLEFLTTRGGAAAQIYLLGDIFEMWIGDDDDGALATLVGDTITGLTAAGVGVAWMHGNRDFLVGERFAARTGMTLLEDPTVLDVAGVRYLLSHGDALCTDDEPYQNMRAIMRSPAWQAEMLAKPLEERRRIGAQLRAASRSANANKASAIMDVNADAVAGLLEAHDARWLIHGHTHRPGIHRVVLSGGRVCQRLVLGDWDRFGWWAELDDRGPTLLSRALAPVGRNGTGSVSTVG